MPLAQPTDAFISTATGNYPGAFLPREVVLKNYPLDLPGIEHISHRVVPSPMKIVPYSDSWPSAYITLERRIIAHMPASELLYVQHVGSTSIPGMPAKPVIDIDIVVRNVNNESVYRPCLEAAGIQFLFRERNWWGHRMTCSAEPYANIHIFGPDSAEPLRHRIFRDYLLSDAGQADRNVYADKKKEVMKNWKKGRDPKHMYNVRKEKTVHEILQRAFIHAGVLASEDHEPRG